MANSSIFSPVFEDYDERTLEYVITHVFFHMHHPGFDPPFDTSRNDLALIRSLAVACRAYGASYIHQADKPAPEWLSLANTLENSADALRCLHDTPDGVLPQLSSMRTGDVLVIPLQPTSQDCAIIFRKQAQYTLYESFSTRAGHAHQDTTPYPQRSLEIREDIFSDPDFQSSLSNFLRVSKKRDTWELITGILRVVGRPVEPTVITKRPVRHGDKCNSSRSPLWLSVKVFVQLSLERSPAGRVSYKEFMLFFMQNLADYATKSNLSSDFLYLMLNKIRRRLTKLGPSAPKCISDAVLHTCSCLSEVLHTRSVDVQVPQHFSQPFDLSRLDLPRDTQLTLSHTHQYITSLVKNHDRDLPNTRFVPRPHFEGTFGDFLSSEGRCFEEVDGIDLLSTFYRFEHEVAHGIDDWFSGVTDVNMACIQLQILIEAYLSRANQLSVYKETLDYPSTLLWTTIELWVVLDKLVVKQIPLLADYSPQISLVTMNEVFLSHPVYPPRVHRLLRYISARHTRARQRLSVFSNRFTKRSFAVRYYDATPALQDLKGQIDQSALPSQTLHAKVVVFELRCPLLFDIWRSVTCDLPFFQGESQYNLPYELKFYEKITTNLHALSDLQRYFIDHPRSHVRLQVISLEPKVRFIPSLRYKRFKRWGGLRYDVLRSRFSFELKRLAYMGLAYQLPSGPYETLQEYLHSTTHRSNDILSAQEDCHDDLSLSEFIAFAHLRSGGSLQWINILRELRARTLNFRHREVYILFARASKQVGPISDTGDLLWHQELQDSSFCHALLVELESLFDDLNAGLSDTAGLATISLLACSATLNKSMEIVQRAIQLHGNVRRKTFHLVREALYKRIMSPMNEEDYQIIGEIAAVCRSTFAVDLDVHTPQDIEAALSCAILIQRGLSLMSTSTYSQLLLERDRRLSVSLSSVLKDTILADPSNLGIDLAIRNVWPTYCPGSRGWAPCQEAPNSYWIVGQTADTLQRPSQTMHVNLLDGSLILNGSLIASRLPKKIMKHPTYRQLFKDNNLLVDPSNISGMDFVTRFLVSGYRVHFSLQGNNLAIKAQDSKANILGLIPNSILERDLPPILIHDHVCWMNLSTFAVEVCPLSNCAWRHSRDNWMIYPLSDSRYSVTQGHKSLLVDFRSDAWEMISRPLECLDIPENLLVIASVVDTILSPSLFVSLPRYGLSFFVNDDHKLESNDFKNMVCDEDQSIGTLADLANQLVLRHKDDTEQYLNPRHILIPGGEARREQRGSQVCIMIDTNPLRRWPVVYYTYEANMELGCLTRFSGLSSKLYLAQLLAMTSDPSRPGSLTGRTSIDEAVSLAWSIGINFVERRINEADRMRITVLRNTKSPQLHFALAGLHSSLRCAYCMAREIYIFASEMANKVPKKVGEPEASDRTDKELENYAFTVAAAVYQWSREAWRYCDGRFLNTKLLSRHLGTAGEEACYVLQNGTRDSEAKRFSSWRFQLLFTLPPVLCSKLCSKKFLGLQGASIPFWILLAFAQQSHMKNKALSYAAMSRCGRKGAFLEQKAQIFRLLMSWPSGYYHDNKLMKYLRITEVLYERRSHFLVPSPTLPEYIPESSSDWKITLDQLLRVRSAPVLPDRNRLGWKDPAIFHSFVDGIPLDQFISSLSRNGAPKFQSEYLDCLRRSAYHLSVKGSNAGRDKPTEETLRDHYVRCRDGYRRALDIVKESLGPKTDIEGKFYRSAPSQWPHLAPYTLFRCLAFTSSVKLSDRWKLCLISLAHLALELQRARRLVHFLRGGLDEELFKELENEIDERVAVECPDWLLMELQGNFLIRPTQVDVANEMIRPHSGENTVIQVNMGEGKSSVIIPMCAAALADGRRLVRVIVPKALEKQMLELLAERLGGLLSRPIYHLPFHRNVKGDDVEHIHEVLSRCKADCGILVMRPEHALSLKLACVEKHLLNNGDAEADVFKPKVEESRLSNLLQGSQVKSKHVAGCVSYQHEMREKVTCRWLALWSIIEMDTRDILDEGDEVLCSQSQLIYALGRQQHVDGYPARWAITQQVLLLTKKHISSLNPQRFLCEAGPAGSFPHIRVFQLDAGAQLISLIAEDVVQGCISDLSFPLRLRKPILTFISRRDISQDTEKMVEDYAQKGPSWEILLLLRGLLANRTLLYALMERRWRVDYGLDLNRTLLAVPYRAKDVPAKAAEFGHPDVTILLTCLSYYYGGLTEEQLRHSFQVLLEQDNPSGDYALWVADSASEYVPQFLRTLGSVSLLSSGQWKTHFFPVFKRNQRAIDLYLSIIVFPKHAKEFPGKISTSSWDLAEGKNHLITGFSGTNDVQYLLPTSIAQRDPENLRQTGTNALVLSYLLQPQNASYSVMGTQQGERWTTRKLLEAIIKEQSEIRVLLDVGAQILNSNRQVAEAWLDLTQHSVTGAIYFDEEDELMVLSRNGGSQLLSSSPFSHQLDGCVTYLDHAHTRGTNIIFPHGYRAAVTLGPKVTKDRLVQGCMRMRKLGCGHSVKFFAPPDVDNEIRSISDKGDKAVTTADILHWTIRETWADIQRRAPYWAQQGLRHKSQHRAWTDFCRNKLTSRQLTDSWIQREQKTLVDLYAPGHSAETTFPIVLDEVLRKRCEFLGVTLLPNSRLEEEQEREVSREKEREREVERPCRARPAKHSLHPAVTRFVRHGVILPGSTAFRRVFTTLKNSSASTSETSVWSPYILATEDFCKTIIENGPLKGRVDDYMRPVQWILSGKIYGNDVLVILSPFEADCLMPDIRLSKHVHLHPYVPRTSKDMKPCDDLMLYPIPPVPSNWSPPWRLIHQLNIFAGQLYLRDYASYVWLSRFLGIHWDSEESPNPVATTLATQPSRFKRNILELLNRGIQTKFKASPLPFVMMLLTIRRRGMRFDETHMGRLLQGWQLREDDFPSFESGSSDEMPSCTAPTSEPSGICELSVPVIP